MNFEILNKCEVIFREITIFYAEWNAGKENIIPYLKNQPSTKLRIETIQELRNESMNVRSTGSYSEYKLPNGKWIRYTLKLKVPEFYKLGMKDVYGWLYFNRIITLRDELLLLLSRELKITSTEAEERSRADWCQDFQFLLSRLSDQIAAFEKPSISILREIVTDKTGDWKEIYRSLKKLGNEFIKPVLLQYLALINRYLLNYEHVLNQAEIPISSANESPIKLTHTQIALLYHYRNQSIRPYEADSIALQYGQTSGQRLVTIFNQLISPLHRTSKGKYRVRDIETVIPLLKGENKVKAEQELKQAKNNNRK